MTPDVSGGDASAAPKSSALTRHELSRLRAAASWARFLGTLGIVFGGLLGILFVGLAVSGLSQNHGNGSVGAFSIPLLLAVISLVGAAWLLSGFGRNVAAFLQRGEPATLIRAFGDVRQFFKLWTFVVALTTLLKVLSLFEML